MADSKLKDAVLIVRMPASTRERLYEIAGREGRSVSNVTLRLLEEGLERYGQTGRPSPKEKGRGAEFERAVVSILVAYGLVTAAEAFKNSKDFEPDVAMRSDRTVGQIKQNGERRRKA